ncbi:hypothetical protein RYX36_037325 [Vicia faba]
MYKKPKNSSKVDDSVVELGKKSVVTVIPSDIGTSSYSTSTNVKTLIDDYLYKLLVDNHIREDPIMARIDYVARETEDSRVQLKADLRVDLKDEICAYEGHMAAQIESVKAFIDYLNSNNFIIYIDSTDHVAYMFVPVPHDRTAPHSTFDPSDVFPTNLP